MKRMLMCVLAAGVCALGATAALLVAGPAAAKSGTSTSTTSTSNTSSTGTSTVPASPLPSSTSTSTTPTSTTQLSGSTPDSGPASKYGVVNATVDAATDHEIVASTAFPNFTGGAVDNYYTMAHSHIDNSPFAEGTSSPADTGPVGQTAAAGNFSQPQYADARWPGNDSGKATFGNQGGPYAVANATSYKATAEVSEASGGASGSAGSIKIAAPKGLAKRLRVALAAWKARWLVPLGLKKIHGSSVSLTLPTITAPTVTTPTVSTPVGTAPSLTTPTVTTPKIGTPGKKKSKSGSSSGQASSGNTAAVLHSTSTAELDPQSDAIVTSGQSSLGSVNLAGQIVLDGINVSVTVTNDGKPTDKVSVNVADASIGGVPVTIDQNGVQVQGQGQNLPYQQADDALNSALKQAGVQLFTVLPEVTKSTNEEAVTASAVHILFTQPVDAAGVPSQNVEHIVGEVFVDSLAAPAGPVPNLNLSGSGFGSAGGGFGSAGAGGTGIGGSNSSTSYGSSPTSGSTGGASSQTAPSSFTALLRKPLWLLIAYLVWQLMVIGTGTTLWRWRAGGMT